MGILVLDNLQTPAHTDHSFNYRSLCLSFSSTGKPTLLLMGNSTDVPVSGWVSTPNSRGTEDIIWSCGVTVLLCCWVSVYPNVGSPSDKWYHPLLDKLNLFCIALLGPDFLFGIAFGQWSKARESVKVSDELQLLE